MASRIFSQIGEGQSLLQDQADADRQGPGAAHRQIVDGAVDRQIADIAAGKEDRVDHVGVGGEGQTTPRWVQDGASFWSRGGDPERAGMISSSRSWWLSRPPLPWPSRMTSDFNRPPRKPVVKF